jgi:hypothetical protein
MKLDLLHWENGQQKKIKVLGTWPVKGIHTIKSGLFTCKKGDVLSFNIFFANSDNMPKTKTNRQLHISQIIIRKKGDYPAGQNASLTDGN